MIKARVVTTDPMAQIEAKAWKGLQRAVVYFWTQLQQVLNTSNPRPHKTPAPPGSPPRKRTGWLQRNVQYELDEQNGVARVGVTANAKYGLWLELGTRRMAARPWLLATLKRLLPQLKALADSER